MAPLAGHLVGYLSMFLQLGVLALLTVLVVLVRTSLDRPRFDGWTVGLCANVAALAILAVAVVGRDAGLLPPLPGATIAYAVLEDCAAISFIAAIQRERGLRAIGAPILAIFGIGVVATAITAFVSPTFFDAYRVHSACFGVLLALAAFAGMFVRRRRIGAQLVVTSLAALALDYLHVPLLNLVGMHFPSTYLGLESYVTMVLDIALGVAIVVHTTDGARVELERRNAALGHAERALRDAAYTDALCGVPNRAAFLERIAAPPASGSVAMIDLDNLKTINDRFGHGTGDAALATAARCLRERCGDSGSVYRIGGDEFAAIWDGVEPNAVRGVLAAMDADLAVLCEDLPAAVRVSWGVTAFGAQLAFEDALIAADAQLYDRRTVRNRLSIDVRRA